MKTTDVLLDMLYRHGVSLQQAEAAYCGCRYMALYRIGESPISCAWNCNLDDISNSMDLIHPFTSIYDFYEERERFISLGLK